MLALFQTIDFGTLVQARTSGSAPDVIAACVGILKERITSLVRRVRDGSVEIVLRLASVALTSPDVVKEIRALRPYTIAWSNVPDYMSPKDFHALARACSAGGDAIHFLNSMNWVQDVKGASRELGWRHRSIRSRGRLYMDHIQTPTYLRAWAMCRGHRRGLSISLQAGARAGRLRQARV